MPTPFSRLGILIGLAGLALAGPVTVATAATDPLYAALRAARPDGRQLAVATPLALERDAFRFTFERGTFHFLAPVEGRTLGAVFVGNGSFRLSPATPNERRQLALSSGADLRSFEVLDDTFDSLVLLFADDTFQELSLAAPVTTAAPDGRAGQVYGAFLEHQREDLRTNLHLRLLADLANTPGLLSGVFLAYLDGASYPPAVAAVDPDGAQALRFSGLRAGSEDVAFFVADANRGGYWYLCDRKGEVARRRKSPAKRYADALAYRIETDVARDADLAGTATIELETQVAGLRVLPLEILPSLRLSEATFALDGAEPRPLLWIQEDERADADAAVVFPEPLPKGAKVTLRLAYRGDRVLKDLGEKNFAVEARSSWYPNLGVFTDPATFELLFRVPAGNEVIATGRLVEARTEGNRSVSLWKSDGPLGVAGFNYGRFKKLERRDEPSGLLVTVYTNPGTPDIVREINAYLAAGMDDENFVEGEYYAYAPTPQPTLGKVNTAQLAESALTDGLNSARLFTAAFGPVPTPGVAITQQSQWTFGQSWPSLVFLPYLSFLDGTQRRRLHLEGAKDALDQIGYHEFAHQWWGHLVVAESYRDQWLEEGFAEFSAALAVQHTLGWGNYDRFFRQARRALLEKAPGNAFAPWEAGPITQGVRLSTQRTPSAYRPMVYSKGGYVLHMLRQLMADGSGKSPDAAFFAMLRDFTSSFAGKAVTTADFQMVVERHMTPAMNATGDGKMDWFFEQWVHGIDLPRYTTDLKVEPAGEGTYRVTGKVTQEGVGAGFRALVPLYLELGKNEMARVGTLPLVGSTSLAVDVTVQSPKKPRRALVNVRGEVLARD